MSTLNIALIAVAAYLLFGLLLGAQFLYALTTISAGRSLILKVMGSQRRTQVRQNAQDWLDVMEELGITHGRFVAGMAFTWPTFLRVLTK